MSDRRCRLLQTQLSSADKQPRPVLTSLNGDNSWLMSFPRPETERAAAGKVFYHVVFEPWLEGPTSMLGSWFINISLSSSPAIPDAEAVKDVVREIEDAAAIHLFQSGDASAKAPKEEPDSGGIDAILLGFHYLDHVHEATLRKFSKDIPVIATPEAADIVRRWGHFETIKLIQDLEPSIQSWRTPELHPGEPLPLWLTPIRLPGFAVLNFCLAIVWTHPTNGEGEVHEVILSSPHGTRFEGSLEAFRNAVPKTKMLAMLHGLKESHTLGSQTTLGAKGGLEIYRKVGGVKYWVLSHHSKLLYGGIFLYLAWTQDTQRTVSWMLEEEQKADSDSAKKEKPNVVEVDNGGSFVLED
ncbi:hypothetical protein NCS57_01110100 [Fusarium keratoplasticum]|uniref:Uncharacterized protein n=1 Tax=Fusarium keratoplasticum TaxID=1328300 RepID=A0ACC0QKR6_9HYPO|nr:hypothetical protein NCS57_01110100 [Fusarium keratoplasticum]KAI8657321.1 hypothetical protein NCS57_01110100 [Fusarium keratoplasticum]